MTHPDPVINLLISNLKEIREEHKEISEGLSEIREILAEQRGHWRGAKAVAAGISAFVGFVMGLFNFIITNQMHKPGGS